MLFSSYHFIFLFLPLTIIVFQWFARRNDINSAIWFLVFASLIFYGWWEAKYLLLITVSMLFNYVVGKALSNPNSVMAGKYALLAFGVAVNLLTIGYFKYFNFFIDTTNSLFNTGIHVEKILLPLAISFFTFQQIAYLVDAYRKEVKEVSFRDYCLFVTFFPQLIAGPIVHHKEMLPQFFNKRTYEHFRSDFSIGLSIFVIGLFKKVVVADGLAVYADTIFGLASNGYSLTLLEAWLGALSYTLQLYFDFSGYSDMALGIARMFGIKLPLNFFSPYKAASIIEFWRRWHMTLSRFLRDYLYFPLGGSRNGSLATYRNLFLVMLLGGIWHGAGWTFILWGCLHGGFLLVNHGWRSWKSAVLLRNSVVTHPLLTSLSRMISVSFTFLLVVVAWVYFRADSVGIANSVLKGMAGLNGVVLPMGWEARTAGMSGAFEALGITFGQLSSMGPMFPPMADILALLKLNVEVENISVINALACLVLPLVVVFFCPNTYQLMRNHRPALEVYDNGAVDQSRFSIAWKPSLIWALIVSFAAAYAIVGSSSTTRFLYFNF